MFLMAAAHTTQRGQTTCHREATKKQVRRQTERRQNIRQTEDQDQTEGGIR